jgi:hypothetical protein
MMEPLKCVGGCGAESQTRHDHESSFVPTFVCARADCHKRLCELEDKACIFCGALPGYAHTLSICDGPVPTSKAFVGMDLARDEGDLTAVQVHGCDGYVIPKEFADEMLKTVSAGQVIRGPQFHVNIEPLSKKEFVKQLKAAEGTAKELRRVTDSFMRRQGKSEMLRLTKDYATKRNDGRERGPGIAALDLTPKRQDFSGWRTEEDNLPDEK